MSLAPPTAGVNLAAAFSQANVAEGTAAAERRGAAQFGRRSYAKVQFKFPRAESYVLRAVVEARYGGAPRRRSRYRSRNKRRTSAVVDYFDQRMIGLHFVGPGPVDVNPTGRRPGLLLTRASCM